MIKQDQARGLTWVIRKHLKNQIQTNLLRTTVLMWELQI